MALYTEALLERETNLSDRARASLEIIQRAVDDVAQTVARMGEFYRSREPEVALEPVDLNLLLEHVADLTRVRWSDMAQQRGAVIEMRLQQDAALPRIAAVQSQIRDALTNLVFNAVDAMPQGGTLTLRTRVDPAARGRNVIVEVSDTGVGMDEQTRRRCLEPFFTTKGTRGTGLGLAMVYGVAERHGATISVDSEPGKGTRTVVRLPLTLAIMDGMELAVGSEVYIAPLSAIVESLRPAPGDVKTIANDSQVLNLRGEIVPVLSLAKALGTEHGCKPGEEVLVVVENGGRRAALAADALLGQQQIVVKNLEGNFGKVSGVAGATILGNGAVSLILDIPELMRVALGAERRDVLWLVIREAAIVVAIGAALGVPLAILAGRGVASQLYGVRPVDPASYAAAAVVLTAIAGFAAFLPAHRASRIDPMAALRKE